MTSHIGDGCEFIMVWTLLIYHTIKLNNVILGPNNKILGLYQV